MMAMQAKRGAALISAMLHHDHTVVIEKERSIAAAAADPHNPSIINLFLQTKGKLGNVNPAKHLLTTRHLGSARKSSTRHLPNQRREYNSSVWKYFLERDTITATEYSTTGGCTKVIAVSESLQYHSFPSHIHLLPATSLGTRRPNSCTAEICITNPDLFRAPPTLPR